MKKLLTLVLLLVSLFSNVSCSEGYVDDVYGDDITVIVTNGTPYYHDGIVWYYYYNNLYYYRFFYNGYWYLRPYGRLYTWEWYDYYNRHYFRPHHSDHKFRHGNRPHSNVRPHNTRPPRVGNHVGPRNNNETIRPNNHGGLGRDNSTRPRGGQRPSSGRRH